MAITEQAVLDAENRMEALRENGFAVAARYDQRHDRFVVTLSTGIEVAFPPRLAEGLAGAALDDPAENRNHPGRPWPALAET